MFPVVLVFGVIWLVRKLFFWKGPVLLGLNSSAGRKSEEALCGSCMCSLIRKDNNGKEFTFCNYGGRMSPVEFVVIECSGYENRYVERPEKIAGFIKPEIAGRNHVTVIRIAAQTGTN